MRYWGFNTIYSILSSCARITGELYIPVSSKRIAKLITLAKKHTIRIHRKKDASWHADEYAKRYPLLVTNSDITSHNIFSTIHQYLAAKKYSRELILLLDGITDVGNIAAIFRSAYNFGVTCVVMSYKTGKNIPVLMHRSAGYYLHTNVVSSANIAQAIQILKDNAFWIYGADVNGSAASDIVFDASKCALVVGDEHIGLRMQTRKLCDFLVAIPNRAECDSLNVSVATGILLYEINRQQSVARNHDK